MPPPVLSIVSPVFKAADLVDELVSRISESAAKVTPDFEIILVDDGSPDESWSNIVATCARDARVKGIRLSRNFGQHQAIAAGLTSAQGEFTVVLDCDLQDDPFYIPTLVEKAREGFDIVLTRKTERRHSWRRNLGAGMFVRIINTLTEGKPADSRLGGYSLINRQALDSFLRINDAKRHYLLILRWMGFRQAVIEVEHHPRRVGRSSYGFRRLVSHAIEGITSQSTKLLRLSVAVGFAYVFSAIIGVVYLIVTSFLHGYRAGWASTFVLLLGSTGFILMAIGVLGIYIGNIFEQVRQRPLYLVQECRNFPAAPQ